MSGVDFETVEIHPVFELVRSRHFDEWSDRTEQAAGHPLVRVADILRDQWQQDFATSAVRHRSCQQVEEKIKRGLPATGDRHVFRPDIPAKLTPEQSSHRFQKPWIAARRIVGREGAVKAAGLG